MGLRMTALVGLLTVLTPRGLGTSKGGSGAASLLMFAFTSARGPSGPSTVRVQHRRDIQHPPGQQRPQCVRVLVTSNIQGIGISASVFRRKSGVITVSSSDTGTARTIAAADLAAS